MNERDIAEQRRLHEQSLTSPVCAYCLRPWPCATKQMLDSIDLVVMSWRRLQESLKVSPVSGNIALGVLLSRVGILAGDSSRQTYLTLCALRESIRVVVRQEAGSTNSAPGAGGVLGESYVCPVCKQMKDTPMHELGCDVGGREFGRHAPDAGGGEGFDFSDGKGSGSIYDVAIALATERRLEGQEPR